MVTAMKLTAVDPDNAPASSGGYTNAMQVDTATRLLFISGQVPQTRAGHVPVGIEEQCRTVWANLLASLLQAGMNISNLVKVTTFLSDRAFAEANTAVRNEILGDHQPALTVIITGIYDETWLLEIEAVAAS